MRKICLNLDHVVKIADRLGCLECGVPTLVRIREVGKFVGQVGTRLKRRNVTL